jgi:regulator of cell morphogenesis and NO signaling
MEIRNNHLISEIIAEDYRAAGIFKNYGIDFCCNGNRSIQTACDERKIEIKN